MIPINGKPVIWWILDSIKKQNNLQKIIVVIDSKDFKTKQYLNQFDLPLSIQEVHQSPNILHSLQWGLSHCDPQMSTGILLGDTLFTNPLNTNKDVLYVHPVKQASRWCVAQFDSQNNLQHLLDKPQNIIEDPFALCGYYHFLDTTTLIKACSTAIENRKAELSECILNYQKKFNFIVQIANDWLDFGNPDHMVISKHKLLQSRSFNSVSVNINTNTLTKKSKNTSKLKDELNWFQQLPPQLAIFTPRVLSSGYDNDLFQIEQEFYGYYTLSELYLFADLDIPYWETILDRTLQTYHQFKQFQKPSDESSLKLIYHDKTIQRVQILEKQSDFWSRILNSNSPLLINQKTHHPYPFLKPWILEKITRLYSLDYFSIIHGDLCFSNILFDLNGHVSKFIDPRGRFGNETLYGDSRYDMAKLRHSIHGKYDYIVNDLFKLHVTNTFDFQLDFFQHNAEIEVLTDVFDQLLIENQYNINDISFIEALLFLTMIPLHADNESRQIAMYLTAMKLFNTLYENENSA